ncbi:SDR family NAD(P)-dependent oxidoreductase [Enterovirga rhinocerotis]|uniref:NAD(P)-dependent dehydrogenase (Short-subunit alcohol dehydrogenase family) n=1 Tax=Enterovirga rhinocerotis TaxID=1339210 RepID=A0A4V3DWN3_9HYPH|nr:glucose 1-dehydrogenase [Enterovirga rhinocerotis]TDR85519.1 NAD(P)-dependent dehydrogenase (short-subunit alcohol dehydrogenase family) [Enterovirga rhinocerotis]
MRAPTIDLSGRTALVTGATGGIGAAIARTLAACGSRVVLSDLDADRLGLLQADLPDGTLAVAGNLGSVDGAEALAREAIEGVRTLDILVNCAGIAEPLRRTLDQDLDDWQRVIDVNLRGAFVLSREVGRHILGRKAQGAIVNIASVVGLFGVPGSNAYGVSKAALIHLTKNLACEWSGKGVRVNAVAPGYIEAPLAFDMFASGRVDRAQIEARLPMRRLGQPEEIAAAVAFLASDAAAYITGVTLPVDGGCSAYGGP